jgi:hypothetical protein
VIRSDVPAPRSRSLFPFAVPCSWYPVFAAESEAGTQDSRTESGNTNWKPRSFSISEIGIGANPELIPEFIPTLSSLAASRSKPHGKPSTHSSNSVKQAAESAGTRRPAQGVFVSNGGRWGSAKSTRADLPRHAADRTRRPTGETKSPAAGPVGGAFSGRTPVGSTSVSFQRPHAVGSTSVSFQRPHAREFHERNVRGFHERNVRGFHERESQSSIRSASSPRPRTKAYAAPSSA